MLSYAIRKRGKTLLLLTVIVTGAIGLLITQPNVLARNLDGQQTSGLLALLGLDSTSSASLFTAPLAGASIALEQCHNFNSQASAAVDCSDPFPGGQTNWGSGNAQYSNAHLREGDNQNFRAIMQSVPASGTPYTLEIELDLTKGGKMAYDRYSSPGKLITATDSSGFTKAGPGITPESLGIFPCQNNNNASAYCTPGSGVAVQIPAYPAGLFGTSGTSTQRTDILNSQTNATPEYMFLYGNGTLSIDSYSFTGDLAGDSSVKLSMSITKTGAGTLVLAWGGHVSNKFDYTTSGTQTAASISGSPYHMRLKSFSALSGDPGNQDMQMASSAIIAAPALTVTKVADASTVNAGDPIGFTITVTNTGNVALSNVLISDQLPTDGGLTWSETPDVSQCSISSSSLLTCTFSSLNVGASVSVHVTSSATSASLCAAPVVNTVTVTADGITTGVTAQASVTVDCPNLSITKTPDQAGDTGYEVHPGGTASFTITVSNSGPGSAYGVVITDTLPGAPDLTWSVTSESPNLAACSVTGGVNLTCSVGTLAANASFTVVVTSSTIPTSFLEPTPGTGSALEIDGNLLDDNPPADAKDWATIGINCTSNPKVGCDLDKPTGKNDDSFGQGTKEDTAVPTVVSGAIPNNKSDLLRFYVATEHVTAGDFLDLAWERVQAPKGTTNMDFEFNQSSQFSANGKTPLRTAGDLLVKYDLDNGGTVPTLGFHTWITGSNGETSADCEASNSLPCWNKVTTLVQSGTGDVAGAVNTVSVSDPIDPNAPRTLDPLTFGEAKINLQQLFPGSVCVSFGQAYLKSRSSSSFSAEIKDFIAPFPVNISTCPPKELNNTAYASATNFAPSGGNPGDQISDTGKIIVSQATQAALRPVSAVLKEAIAALEPNTGSRFFRPIDSKLRQKVLIEPKARGIDNLAHNTGKPGL